MSVIARYLFRGARNLNVLNQQILTKRFPPLPSLIRSAHTDTNKHVIARARNAFDSGRTLGVPFRLEQLRNLLRMLNECEDEILTALYEDLRKSKMEAKLYEVELIRAEINNFLRNLENYVKPDKLPFNLLAALDAGYIQRDPFGVVLILGPWNFPFAISLTPLIGAIAAGNCSILKPSEMAPQSAATMARLLPRYLDQECYQVIEGNLEAAKSLLTNKFDYIFATGSGSMGRSVYAAAAVHLTPVTLELGGKSPVYIDDSSDLELAARRILWGKCMNLGQTCIAPDYILCSKKVEAQFLDVASRVLTEWYGTAWKKSHDLSRIVNKRSFLRIDNMLKSTKGRVVLGGETDEDDLWISPTIIVDVEESDSLMSEEIFGPILPILTVNSSDAAIRIILSGQKPLALYVFSKDDTVIQKFLSKTSSGSVCINDVVWHFGWEGLPFGGVGESGIGNNHWRFSYETFSHKKAVLHRGFNYLSEKMGEPRYSPYTQNKMRYFTFVLRYIYAFNVIWSKTVSHAVAGSVGALLLYLWLKCC